MNSVRTKKFLIVVAVWTLIVGPFCRCTVQAAPVALPSGKIVEMTAVQLEALSTQAGIQVVSTIPAELAADAAVIALPAELGGGFLLGTPGAIAAGLNAAGITAGATAAFVGGVGITAAAVGTVAGVGALAAVAGALSGGKEDDAASHAAVHH